MSIFYALDILGTIAFAISGTLAAMHKRLDLFGVFIIAFVTAVGGGTLRDILIDRELVSWMQDLNYVYAIVVATTFAIIIRKKIAYLRTSLFLFDTIGLGIFTIIGTEIGIQHELHPVITVILGTLTATFGGVLRDILCNEIPVIFKKEIYAMACIAGSIVFIVLSNMQIDTNTNYIITTLIVIIIRLLAVKFRLSLPTLITENKI